MIVTSMTASVIWIHVEAKILLRMVTIASSATMSTRSAVPVEMPLTERTNYPNAMDPKFHRIIRSKQLRVSHHMASISITSTTNRCNTTSICDALIPKHMLSCTIECMASRIRWSSNKQWAYPHWASTNRNRLA